MKHIQIFLAENPPPEVGPITSHAEMAAQEATAYGVEIKTSPAEWPLPFLSELFDVLARIAFEHVGATTFTISRERLPDGRFVLKMVVTGEKPATLWTEPLAVPEAVLEEWWTLNNLTATSGSTLGRKFSTASTAK
jgi:hypothetical protein